MNSNENIILFNLIEFLYVAENKKQNILQTGDKHEDKLQLIIFKQNNACSFTSTLYFITELSLCKKRKKVKYFKVYNVILDLK